MAALHERHRGRVAVGTAFLAHSAVAGTWASRIPAVKHDLGLSDGQLGLALFGTAVGTLVGSRLGGIVATRVGAWRVVRAGVPILAAWLVAIALAGNLAELAAVLVVSGIVAAMVDVSMNAEAVVVEQHARRPLMSGLHGMWSLGLLGGAMAGVAAAAAGIDPTAHFAIAAVVVAAATAPLLASLPHRAVAHGHEEHRADRWSLPIVALGLLTFASFFSEGAAVDWSAVFMRDRVGATSAVAAAAVAGFSLGMVAARLAGDRLVARFGPVRLVAVSTAVAAAGLTAALAVPDEATGIAGFTLLGAGLGPVVPTAVSAAGRAGLGTLEGVVSRVFTIGYVGSVSGPAVIGFVSSRIGLRAALLIPLCLIVAILAGCGRLRPAAGARAPEPVRPAQAGVGR